MAFNIRTVTLAAATATKVADKRERIRGVVNIGTGLATLGISSGVVAGTGWPLAAASAAGDQGGGYSFEVPTEPGVDLYAISTAGTTLAVMEG